MVNSEVRTGSTLEGAAKTSSEILKLILSRVVEQRKEKRRYQQKQEGGTRKDKVSSRDFLIQGRGCEIYRWAISSSRPETIIYRIISFKQ